MPEYKSPQSESGMERRFLLVFLLMAVVIFGSQLFLKKYAPQQPPSTARPNQPIQTPPAQSGPATPVPAQPARPQKPLSTEPTGSKQASSESETVIENDFYRVTFTNRGAQVKSWILKKYSDDQGRPLDLVNSGAAAKYGYPLSLWTYDESQRTKLNSAMYVASETGAINVPATVTFEYADSGLDVRKTFHFDHSYVVQVETSVFANDSPVNAFPAWPAGFGDQTTHPGYASGQFEYQLNNDTEHVSVKKVSGGSTLHGTFDWAGVSDSYFAAVFIPDNIDNVNIVSLRNSLDVPPDPSKPSDTKPDSRYCRASATAAPRTPKRPRAPPAWVRANSSAPPWT